MVHEARQTHTEVRVKRGRGEHCQSQTPTESRGKERKHDDSFYSTVQRKRETNDRKFWWDILG